MAKEEKQETKSEGEDIQQKVEAILSNEELPEHNKISQLHEIGFTRKQLIQELGFAKPTVYRTLPTNPEGEPEKPKPDSDVANHSRLPITLKAGQGREVINPDAILEHFLQADGDAGAWMLKGFMLYRAAQLAVMTDVEIMKGQAEAQATAIKPILDIMEKAREDMDAAAERAKASTEEVAQAAAAGAAARAAIHIDERFDQMAKQKADIATVQDPMKGLAARTMETIMNQLTGQMFGGKAPGLAPSFVDKREEGGK